MDEGKGRENWINEDLAAALRTMYESYAAESERWERDRTDSQVPAIVAVASAIANADGLFRYIAGYENDDGIIAGGQLGGLLSNADGGAWRATPRTILIHSEMEAEDGKTVASIVKPIRTLANTYRERYPSARLSEDRRDRRRPAEGTDYEVLRRALNTVGKPGEPGEGVRCVVSVGMITEGWDARTVTHTVGFRAFGESVRRRGVEAVLDDGAPLKLYIPFQECETRREHVCETVKSESSHAVCDSGWEVSVARKLDLRDDVIGWVRNERLNRFIPWPDESEQSAIWRRCSPDFAARVDDGNGGVLNLAIEVKWEEREQAA